MNEIDIHLKNVTYCFECKHYKRLGDTKYMACELSTRIMCKWDYCSDAEPKEEK